MTQKTRDFDVCVIGGGPGGYAAALRAWDYDKRVAIVERGELGGTGVHNGALSSKTLWEISRDYLNATCRNRGYIAENVRLDFSQINQCVRTAIMEKVGQLETQLNILREARSGYQGSITHIRGQAHFVDPHTLSVDIPDTALPQILTADHFVIATGSRPRTVPSIPVDGEIIMTSDHLMRLKDFPRSLVILGAGVVGCEFATIFANFGQTKVHLIDRAERILPFEDEDIARVCSTNLEHRGVTIHHRAQLKSMRVVDGEVEYTIQQHTGGIETIRVEKALVSVGRIPNTATLRLENVGLELDERGFVVDDDTATNIEHIYAAGDVTQDVALVSVAEIEGRHAIEKIYENTDKRLSYENLATIMFLDPEVAAIGMNEKQAQAAKISYKVAVYGYDLVNRAIAMRSTEGFVKMLVTDCEDMKILGVRALGVHASTVIEAVSLMIRQGRSIRDLAELFHPHPAIPEGLQDCVRMLLGTSIYKPHVFNSSLRLSHVTYAGDEPQSTP